MNYRFVCCLLAISLLLPSCRRDPVRHLVVSSVTHFEIQGDSTSLDLPVFAATLDVGEIVRDVAQAEYYRQKLARVYKFQNFTLKQSESSEILLDREGMLSRPQKILRSADNAAVMEILLTSFQQDVASYSFRISDPAEKHVRDHAVEVPSGKSASIGTMFDQRAGVGHIVVISTQSFPVTRKTAAAELAAFLRQKNALPGDSASPGFVAGDQKWMDELFGRGAMKLPLPASASSGRASDSTRVRFDVAPALLQPLDVSYPESAKRDSFEGQVVIEFEISRSGLIGKCRVIKSARADLDSAALDAVKRARFSPAIYQGDSVTATVAMPVRFKLD